jgi:pimeloyl-ACP methyl ester carboxylesterase
MAGVQANGIHIEFDDRGPQDAEAVVLLAGGGEQIGSVEFPEDFCDVLAGRGFRVLRMDNRDAGLSTAFPDHPVDLAALLAAHASGAAFSVPYTLADMADDVAGLLDALAIPRAHVLGASLGGLIARWVAVRHLARVRSLTLVMTGSGAQPGEADVDFRVAPEMLALMLRMNERVDDREQAIARVVETWRALWGPGSPFDERWVRSRVAAAYDRSYRPEGTARQMAATVATGGLFAAQSRIQVPTLIVHGDSDPLLPVAHAQVAAQAIPGARLRVIEGMGHEMAPRIWPELIRSFEEVARGEGTGVS